MPRPPYSPVSERASRPEPPRRPETEVVAVPWTPELVLRVARVDPSWPRRRQVKAVRDANLSSDALKALGWPELTG